MQLSHRVKLFTAVLIIVLCNTIYSCAQGDFGTPAGSPQAMTANDIAEIQTVWIKKKLKRNNEQLEKADTNNKKFVVAIQEYQKAEKNHRRNWLHCIKKGMTVLKPF